MRRRRTARFAFVLSVAALACLAIRWPATSHAAQVAPPATRLTLARVNAFLDADRRHLRYLPGEAIVKFKSGVTVGGQTRALTSLRSRPDASALRWIGDVAVLSDQTEPDSEALARELSTQPEVQFAEANYLRRVDGWTTGLSRAIQAIPLASPPLTSVPNDPDYSDLQWNFSLINMPQAWAINPGSVPTLTVALIDTGETTAVTSLTFPLWTGTKFENVAMNFAPSPDIAATRFTKPQDFVFLDPGGPVVDMVGHGTHTASTLAEDTNNGLGLAGIAYNVKIMPVKVCLGYWELMIAQAENNVPGFVASSAGGCPEDAIIAGIRYAADNGAKVLNISLGGPDPDAGENDALQYAVEHGAFVSIAMGNGFESGNPVQYPASYAASIDGAMSVGAVGKAEERAYYSSTGSYNEIVAPGGDDRFGGGDDQGYVWQVTLTPDDSDPTLVVRPRFDRYAEVGYEGTSMATPHVAGLAALLMSQGTLTNPAAIEALIKATAQDLGPKGRDDEFGYGLVQPRNALFGFAIRK